MPVPRRWALVGLAALTLGSLAAVQSFARVEIISPGLFQIAGPSEALISTPDVTAEGHASLLLTLPSLPQPPGLTDDDSAADQAQGVVLEKPHGARSNAGYLTAFATVTNHMPSAIVADGVGCANPDLFVSMQRTGIQSGETARIPLEISPTQSAAPGQEPLSLMFQFVWPTGSAQIGAQAELVIVRAPDSPPGDTDSNLTADGQQ